MNAVQIIKSVMEANKIYDQMSVGFPTEYIQLEVTEEEAIFTHKFSGEVTRVADDYKTIMSEIDKQLNITNAAKISQLFAADNVQQFTINDFVTVAKADGKIIIREKMEDVLFPVTFDFSVDGLKKAISK